METTVSTRPYRLKHGFNHYDTAESKMLKGGDLVYLTEHQAHAFKGKFVAGDEPLPPAPVEEDSTEEDDEADDEDEEPHEGEEDDEEEEEKDDQAALPGNGEETLEQIHDRRVAEKAAKLAKKREARAARKKR